MSAALPLLVVQMALSVEPCAEDLVKDGVLFAKILFGQLIRLLQAVDKRHTEREACADKEDRDVHEVKVRRNVGWVAFVGELWDRGQPKEAEGQEYGAEGEIHELGNAIDDPVEPFGVLLAAHECKCEYEAHRRRQDGVGCEDDAHADLRFVALLVNFSFRSHLDHGLLFNDLLHHKGVRDHDQQAGCCDQF